MWKTASTYQWFPALLFNLRKYSLESPEVYFLVWKSFAIVMLVEGGCQLWSCEGSFWEAGTSGGCPLHLQIIVIITSIINITIHSGNANHHHHHASSTSPSTVWQCKSSSLIITTATITKPSDHSLDNLAVNYCNPYYRTWIHVVLPKPASDIILTTQHCSIFHPCSVYEDRARGKVQLAW